MTNITPIAGHPRFRYVPLSSPHVPPPVIWPVPQTGIAPDSGEIMLDLIDAVLADAAANAFKPLFPASSDPLVLARRRKPRKPSWTPWEAQPDANPGKPEP